MNGIIREVTIGPCRLIQGDCMDVLPLLGKVDAVVTDPPYGIGFASQPTKWQREKGEKPIGWDDATVGSLAPVLAMAPIQVVWGGNYYPLPVTRGWLSWFKPDAPPSMANFELAWTNLDRNAEQISWSISATNAERVGHPTQKPLAVMEWCLNGLPEGCNSIIDPFMGSGTTGVACIRTDRQFIGIEREPKYFDIAVKRIEQAWRLKRSELPIDEPMKPRQLDLIMGSD